MKKLTLLLIPALLAISACQGGGSSVEPSSSGAPSSEPSSSVEPSSSEEPLPIPTMEELILAYETNTFTLDLSRLSYDGDALTYDAYVEIQKDGEKVAYLEREVDEQGEYHYVPLAYGENVDYEMYSYYQYEEHWLVKKGFVEGTETAQDVLSGIYSIFNDVEVGDEFEWTHDEEAAIYFGVKVEHGFRFECTIQLCPGFFSGIIYKSIDVNNEDDYTINTFAVANYCSTVVTLPETPVSYIFDSLNSMAASMRYVDSFTLDYEKVTYTEHSSTSLTKNIKVVNDVANREVLVEVVMNNLPTHYFYKDSWDELGQHTYYAKENDGDWEEADYDRYQRVTSEAFTCYEIDSFDSQESLAAFIKHVVTCEEGNFTFDSETESLEFFNSFSFSFDTDTYEMKEMISRFAGLNEFYSYSGINSTEIDA